MKKIFLIICAVSALTGCSRQALSPPYAETTLGPEFESEFDRLFLSQDPLRYQDNIALLISLHPENLADDERQVVRAKLKAFLSYDHTARGYAEDCYQTGVADPFAFLRLESVRLLAHVGKKDDIEFIHKLDKRQEINHPSFGDECKRAISLLKNR